MVRRVYVLEQLFVGVVGHVDDPGVGARAGQGGGQLGAGGAGHDHVREHPVDGPVVAVAAGEHYLSPELSGFLIRNYLEGRSTGASAALRTLSEREREVVQLVAEGHNGRSIADLLGVSRRTVESHRRKINDKLGFSDTAGLTRGAIKHHLVPL